jgi:hypothetical protein
MGDRLDLQSAAFAVVAEGPRFPGTLGTPPSSAVGRNSTPTAKRNL